MCGKIGRRSKAYKLLKYFPNRMVYVTFIQKSRQIPNAKLMKIENITETIFEDSNNFTGNIVKRTSS